MTGSPISDDRQALASALDAVPVGLLFLDLSGTVVRMNRALDRMLRERDGEQLHAPLEGFAAELRHRLRERTPPSDAEELALRDVCTPGGWYRLRGSFIGLDLFGHGEALLVSVEPFRGMALSDETLRARFRLTGREVRIARLLAEGRSNTEIAERLHISPHTARTHTERVLRKLELRSRAEVGSRIRPE